MEYSLVEQSKEWWWNHAAILPVVKVVVAPAGVIWNGYEVAFGGEDARIEALWKDMQPLFVVGGALLIAGFFNITLIYSVILDEPIIFWSTPWVVCGAAAISYVFLTYH